jgi:hypothetical protein
MNVDVKWDIYRDGELAINLVSVFHYVYEKEIKKRPEYRVASACDYLREIMSIKPVVSRQTAAVALATAATLMRY